MSAAASVVQEKDAEALPVDEQIRRRAYQRYLERGDRPGSELDDWLEAEKEILGKEPPTSTELP